MDMSQNNQKRSSSAQKQNSNVSKKVSMKLSPSKNHKANKSKSCNKANLDFIDAMDLFIKAMEKDKENAIKKQRDKRHPVFQVGFGPTVKVKLDDDTVEEMKEMIDKLREVKVSVDVEKHIKEALREIKEEVPKITEEFHRVASEAPKVTRNMTSMERSLQEGMSNISDVFNVSLAMVLILVCVIKVRKGGSKWWYALLYFAANLLITTAGKHGYLGDDFQKNILSMTDPIMHPQVDVKDGFQKGMRAMLTFFSVYTTSKVPKDKKIDTFISRAGNIPKAAEGIDTMVNWAYDTVKSMVNFVRCDVLGMSMIAWADSTAPDVTDWSKDVTEFLTDVHLGKVPVDIDNADRVHNLILRGASFSVKYFHSKEHARIRDIINQHMNLLRKQETRFNQANLRGAGVRKEPTAIYLRGPTGVGKTMVSTPLAVHIAKTVMPEAKFLRYSRNWKELFYQRHPEDDYWDGYHGQYTVIFDEAGQIRDAVGNQVTIKEWMDILRTVGVNTNVLHMADLQSKGVVEMTSELAICTSNMPDFRHIQSIIQPEAVERRMDVIADVVPKPEYCVEGTVTQNLWDRRLDKSKVPGGYTREIYEFHIYDPKLRGYPRFMHYDAFIQYCANIKYEKDQNHVVYAHRIDEIIHGLDEDQTPVHQKQDPFNDFAHIVTSQVDKGKGKAKAAPVTEEESNILGEVNVELDMDEVVLEKEEEHLYKTRRFGDYCDLDDLLSDINKEYDRLDEVPINKASFWTLWGLRFDEYIDYECMLLEIKADLGEDKFKQLMDKPEKLKRLGLFYQQTGKLKHLLQRTRSRMSGVSERIVNDVKNTDNKIVKFFSSIVQKCSNIMQKYPRLKMFLMIAGSMGAMFGIFKVLKYIFPDYISKIEDSVSSSIGIAREKVNEYKESVDDYLLDNKLRCMDEGKDNWTETMRKFMSGLSERAGAIFNIMMGGKVYKGYHISARYNGSTVTAEDWFYKADNPTVVRFLPNGTTLNFVDAETGELITHDIKEAQEVAFWQIDSGTKGRGQQPKQKNKVVSYSMKDIANVQPQGCTDPNAKETLFAIVKHNQYTIHVPNKDKKIGIVTFITGQIGMFPYHFLKFFQNELECDPDNYNENTIIELKNQYSGRKYSIPLEVFLNAKVFPRFESRDLCFAFFPGVICHRNIVKNFIKQSVLASPHDKNMFLAVLDPTAPTIYASEYEYWKDYIVQWDTLDPETQYTVINTAYIVASTNAGDCGAIGSLNNPAIGPGKLFYIHIAGSKADNKAIGTVVTQEDMEYVVEQFPKVTSIPTPQCVEFLPRDDSEIIMGVCPVAKLPKIVFNPNKTKIMPSELHNVIKHSKLAPARLGEFIQDGEIINPLRMAISKYSVPGFTVRPAILQQAYNHMVATVMNRSKVHTDRIIFSFEEAVLGQPGDPYNNSINRKSGAGLDLEFPHLSKRGKFAFFGEGDEYDLDNLNCERLRMLVLRDIDQAKRGIRQLHIFSDYLKDETRTLAKVYEGRTRMISGAPLRLVIGTRMLFLSFSIWVMRNCVINGMAVGVNPYSNHWDMIVKYLNSISKHKVAGDYKGYDTSMFKELLMCVLEFINTWYNDSDEMQLARYVYFMEVWSSFHASGDTLYQWLSKLPSGHPLTTIINCVVNLILFRIVYIFEVGDLHDFNDNVNVLVYGDDNILSIHNDIIHKFNQHTIATGMARLGFTYTSEDKLTTVAPSRHLHEVGFLKRGFRFEPLIHRYVAPLELDTILEIPMWTKKGCASHTITCDNVDNCLRELSLHDPEVFNLWAPKVISSAREKLDYYPVVVDRLPLLRAVVERQEFF